MKRPLKFKIKIGEISDGFKVHILDGNGMELIAVSKPISKERAIELKYRIEYFEEMNENPNPSETR